MTARLRRRVDVLQGPAIDRAYSRLAALWPDHRATRRKEEVAAELVYWLVMTELARGTPPDIMLRRLPPELARMLEPKP